MDVPVFRAVNSQMDGEPEANLYMEALEGERTYLAWKWASRVVDKKR